MRKVLMPKAHIKVQTVQCQAQNAVAGLNAM
eukprot:CAMPEP_0172898506 /NCGR_PEP_ID=MMETSP1075-20121228/159819_1 /TAXON_ID=2916 /ORGANISM="Ceratium fusus, Strain PA161109" /LENGTH=30 /DNA_ID= /DNA_START= /DNA_END= /DNA_ORIENTATION=